MKLPPHNAHAPGTPLGYLELIPRIFCVILTTNTRLMLGVCLCVQEGVCPGRAVCVCGGLTRRLGCGVMASGVSTAASAAWSRVSHLEVLLTHGSYAQTDKVGLRLCVK